MGRLAIIIKFTQKIFPNIFLIAVLCLTNVWCQYVSVTNTVDYGYVSGNYRFEGIASNNTYTLTTNVAVRVYVRSGVVTNVLSNVSGAFGMYLDTSVYTNGYRVFTIVAVNLSNQSNSYALTNWVENVRLVRVYGTSVRADGVVDTRKIEIFPSTNIFRYGSNILVRDAVIPSVVPHPSNGFWQVYLTETASIVNTNFHYKFNYQGTNLLRTIPLVNEIGFWDLPEF